jgi:NAD(P)-dependent dehydrogenase (short-subunit alcohol dehydrogenase family)
MKDLNNKVAVVTGAASGIGRALAVELAGEGCHLAISDINPTGLADTATMIKNSGITVTTHTVDVADREQVYEFAEDVVKDHHRVDIVINNAGTSLGGSLEEVSAEEFEWLMGINFWGVVHGSMAFLPLLKQQPEANLVNISSVHGLFTNPGVGPYCSSKFAVKGFTQALCQEMKQTPVVVSSVHPGGIRTNIVRNSRVAENAVPEKSREEAQVNFDKFIGRTSSEEAARIIIRGIKKDKVRILVGTDAYFFDLASRLFPVTWQRLMGWLPEFMARFDK